MKRLTGRLTYANVMSSIAVFLVLGGATAFATTQLGKNSVGAGQLKRNAVTAAKIKRNAVTSTKIKKGAVTGAKIKLSSLGTVPSASSLTGYSRKGLVSVGATAGAAEATAREAAPEVPLFSAGAFTIYAKCFAYATTVQGEAFIRTSVNGSVFSGEEDELNGTPIKVGASGFLNTGTLESERGIAEEQTATNKSALLGGDSETGFYAMAPDGTVVRGDVLIAVKNGTLPEGNGVYGSSACLFSGDMFQLNS